MEQNTSINLNSTKDPVNILDSERSRILSSIHQLQRLTDATDRRLKDLKTEYNALIPQFDCPQIRLLADPLDALPQELWESIICISATYVQNNTPIIAIDRILTYILVSSRWQRSICAAPRFWTDIYIGDEVHDLTAKIYLAIELSRGSPLSIISDFYADDAEPVWTDLQNLLILQSPRIRSISVPNGLVNITILSSIFQSIRSFPMLESIASKIWDGELVEWKNILPKIGSLRSIKGIYTSLESLELEVFRRVCTLDFPTLTSEYIFPLQKLEHLSDVTFFEQQPYEDESDTARLLELTEPLCWKSLWISGTRNAALRQNILLRAAPTLVKLGINLSWSDLSNMLFCCHQMPSLCDLALGIDFKEANHDISMPPLPASNIRKLTLQTIYFNFEDSASRFITGFLEAINAWAPCVQDFTVNLVNIPDAAYSCAAKLKDLTRLHVEFPSVASSATRRIELVTLQRLTFFGKSSELEVAICPNVTTLVVIFDDYFRVNIASIIRTDSWSNTRHLTVDIGNIDWKDFTLPCVQSIRMINRTTNENSGNNPAVFFEELVLHPDIFPKLDTLYCGIFPEWDILFLMLESRNFSILKNVSPITRMSFPCVLPPLLMKPLLELLRGKLPTSMNYINYSLSAISDVYFDTSVFVYFSSVYVTT